MNSAICANVVFVGAGVYLHVVGTDRRAGYSAHITLPYMALNNSCMEFFLAVQGPQEYSIQVLVKNNF